WPHREAEATAREGAPALFHRVRLTGLKPHARYRYAVQCGGAVRSGSFVTAALPHQGFRFAVYGDDRTHPEIHAAVLKRLLRFHPAFVVNTGDLVADGRQEALWTEFFQVAEPALCRLPYYPALGNHERDGAAYLRYFDVPREYSFDYGNIHFV